MYRTLLFSAFVGILLVNKGTDATENSAECSSFCENGRCNGGVCQCDECYEGVSCSDKVPNCHAGDTYDRPRSRSKRAISYPRYIDFSLNNDPLDASTDLYTGDKISFRLTIKFPSNSMQDVLVELFTPDNETTIMMLCNVKVEHVGTSLTTATPNLTNLLPVMDRKEGFAYHDRAILDLGNITAESGASTEEDISIKVTFDAIMLDSPNVVNGGQYSVSAGALYNNANEIWVAIKQIKVDDTKGKNVTEKPVSSLGGPPSLEIGRTGQYLLEIQIPEYSVDINIDALAPMNTTSIMSVCSVLVLGGEKNFECLPKNAFQYTSETDAEGRANNHVRLMLGKVVNQGRRGASWSGPSINDTIRIAIMVQFLPNATVGNPYMLGAAVEFGENMIFAGQIAVTANASITGNLNETTNPVVSFEIEGNSSAPVGGFIALNLSIITIENTISEYEVEFLMPYDSGARLRVCGVSISHAGWNVPCVIPDPPTYTSRDSQASIHDRVVMKLGRLTNIGFLPGNSSANRVSIQAYVEVLNHTANVENADLSVSAGVTFGTQRLNVSLPQFSISADPGDNLSKPPVLKMAYGIGDENVHVGTITEVRLTIITKPLYRYYPMDVEIMVPYQNDSAVMSICKVEIFHKGKNLACLGKVEFVLHSKNNDSTYDRATASLGSVYNVKENDTNSTNDAIIIRAFIKVQEHPLFSADNVETWISAGLKYTSTIIWVGQLRLIARIGSKKQLTSEQACQFMSFFTTEDQSNTAEAGRSKKLVLTLKIPPQSTSDYTVDVTSPSDDVSICNLKIVLLGDNLKCFNASILGDYTPWETRRTFNKLAVLDLKKVTNPGTDASLPVSTVDATTMVISALVLFHSTASGSRAIKASVSYYDQTSAVTPQKMEKTVTLAVSAVTPLVSSPATDPEFSLKIAPLLDNENVTADSNVAPGEAVRLFFDIRLKTNSTNKIEVKFMSPLDTEAVADVTNVRVVNAGANIPCVASPTATYGSRAGSSTQDFATLNLEYVSAIDLVEETNETNTIRLEGIYRFRLNSPKTRGDVVWPSAVATINDDRIYVSQVAITLEDQFVQINSNDPSGNVSSFFNTSTSPIIKDIRDTTSLPLVVSIPANSTSRAYLDVQLPVNDSAVMTIDSIEVTRCGENLALFCKEPYEANLTSSKSTSQMNKAILDFGIMTNTGFTYREDNHKDEDDQFEVTIKFTVADAENMVANSIFWISVGFRYGRFIVIIDQQLKVTRTNLERPYFNVSASVSSGQYSKQENITISGTIEHADTSTAEGIRTAIWFFNPPEMFFTGNVVASLEPDRFNVSPNYAMAEWDHFFFTDNSTFSVEIATKPNARMPSVHDPVQITIPFYVSSGMHQRTGNAKSATVMLSSFDHVGFTLSGVADGGASSMDCTPANLGLNDAQKITDCQLSSSGGIVTNARRGMGGWTTFVRDGDLKKARYIEIRFDKPTTVSKVEFHQPGGSVPCSVTKFRVKFSNDQIGWYETDEVDVPDYTSTSQKVLVNKPTESMAIRIHMTEDNCNGDDLKIELDIHGCTSSRSSSSTDSWDPCLDRNAEGRAVDYSDRNFLTTQDDAIFCDAVSRRRLTWQCWSHGKDESGGLKFRKMARVINILGFDPNYKELYGLDVNKKSYLCSGDNGFSWYAVSMQRWKRVEPTAVRAIKVPWVYLGSLTADGTNTMYQDTSGYWGAGFYGLFKKRSGTMDKVADWGQCCN